MKADKGGLGVGVGSSSASGAYRGSRIAHYLCARPSTSFPVQRAGGVRKKESVPEPRAQSNALPWCAWLNPSAWGRGLRLRAGAGAHRGNLLS